MEKNEFAGYFKILEDSLTKKDQLLNYLMKLTREQESCLKKEIFSMEDFDQLMEQKEPLIEKISESDAGFESIYAKLKPEIAAFQTEFASRILEMQNAIKTVLGKGAALCALEEQNKVHLAEYLSGKRQEIKNFKRSNQTVTNYYKNMSGAPTTQSYFMDKKK